VHQAVKSNANKPVRVVVARPNDNRDTIELSLTAAQWKGQGLLGCTVQAWPPSEPRLDTEPLSAPRT
jgi:hypothetical protein